jgi:hypothetical protein
MPVQLTAYAADDASSVANSAPNSASVRSSFVMIKSPQKEQFF